MDDRLKDEILSLAALYQAVAEIRELAENGRWNQAPVDTCFAGLLQPYEGDVAQTYGGAEALAPGLRRLQRQLANPQDMDQTRYVIMTVHLERKLVKRRDMLATLSEGLEQARRQAEYFGKVNENVVGRLADLYAGTISQLRPRILVQGKREWLEDARNANMVRALLLAAIRAATLWRAAGGNRLRLIFGRNRLARATEELLGQVS
ncbi:MAG: high frequency lysogenization protein HflD [Aquisalimonadaceae bacterium]